MADWIIVHRGKEEENETGVRFVALPVGGLPADTIKDIAFDPEKDRGFYWANTVTE